MKKITIIFVLIVSGLLFYSGLRKSPNESFVSMDDDKFSLNGSSFYPVVLNYVLSVRMDKGQLWACPHFGYYSHSLSLFRSKDSSLATIKADMELIKDMGFNTVRLIYIGEGRKNKNSGEISIDVRADENRDTSFSLSSDQQLTTYFKAIDELLCIVGQAGLKAILLTPVVPDDVASEEHLKKVTKYFKHDRTILAYDLFNEPLYFDMLVEREKKDIYQIVKRWRKIVRENAPDQLVTIGLTGVLEVLEWDPNILDVDFLSMHPYEYQPEQVRNEMYWYHKYITKPWIIGETAIPADGDSVSYQEQKIFARNTLAQAYNCGAMGYSWWQYKDVEWSTFHAHYLGVVNNKGETKTSKGNVVKGTVKPLIQEFKMFDPTQKKQDCACLDNYYDYSGHRKFRLNGVLKDHKNNPIQGGIVMAWNEHWSRSHSTYTKEDGSFELNSDVSFFHWKASATMHSVTKAEILPDNATVSPDGIPTISLGTINIGKLSFK